LNTRLENFCVESAVQKMSSTFRRMKLDALGLCPPPTLKPTPRRPAGRKTSTEPSLERARMLPLGLASVSSAARLSGAPLCRRVFKNLRPKSLAPDFDPQNAPAAPAHTHLHRPPNQEKRTPKPLNAFTVPPFLTARFPPRLLAWAVDFPPGFPGLVPLFNLFIFL